MTLTDWTYYSVALGVVTQVATLILFWWLYRYTRLKPALYNLLWHVLSAAWGFGNSYLYQKTETYGHGQAPRLNVYVFATSELVSIAGTALLIWLLVALAHWGHTGLPRKTVPPSPAA